VFIILKYHVMFSFSNTQVLSKQRTISFSRYIENQKLQNQHKSGSIVFLFLPLSLSRSVPLALILLVDFFFSLIDCCSLWACSNLSKSLVYRRKKRTRTRT